MAWTIRYASSTGAGAFTGVDESNAWRPTDINAGAVAGVHTYCKADGDYGSLTLDKNGTDTQAIWFEAYTTTPGDGGKVTTVSISSTGHNHIYQGFTASSSNRHVIRVFGNHAILIDCESTLTDAAASWNAAWGPKGGSVAISCAFRAEGATTAASVIAQDGGPAAMIGCSVSAADGHTLVARNATSSLRLFATIGCVLEGDGTAEGMTSLAGGHITIGSTIAGVTEAITAPLETTGGTGIQLAVNNLIDNCTNGIVASTANKTGMTVSNNCIGRILTARYDLGDTPIFGDLTHTADPFKDAANGNYLLNHDAGGGDVPRYDMLEADRG